MKTLYEDKGKGTQARGYLKKSMRSAEGWKEKGHGRDAVGFEVPCTEHQMLTRMSDRPDFHHVMKWVERVWDGPTMLRECVDDVEERE